MYCAKCGHETSPKDVYCEGCGQSLEPQNSSAVQLQEPVGIKMPEYEFRRGVCSLSLSTTRGILFFGVASCAIMLATEALHAFIHEVLGHAVAAIVVGQRVTGVFISPFGIDYTFITTSPVPILAVFQSAAGTLVSVTAGIIVWKLAYPRIKRRPSFGLRLSALLFIIMLETDLLYTFMSPLFSFGDAFQIAQILSIDPPALLSLAALPLIVIVYYPVLREYLEFLAPYAGKEVMKTTGTRFRFLLKITYAPVILLLAFALIVTLIFSGLGVALFSLIGEGIMVLPIVSVAYIVGRYYDASKRAEIKPATADEARAAHYGLLEYALFSTAFILIVVAIFGPTYESARCCGALGKT